MSLDYDLEINMHKK